MLEGLIIGLHLVSHHAPEYVDQNNRNFGAFIITESGLTAGFYRNTLRRTSLYVGHYAQWQHVTLRVGAITGYRDGLEPLPMVAPGLKLGHGFEMLYVPKAEKSSSEVYHVTYKLEF